MMKRTRATPKYPIRNTKTNQRKNKDHSVTKITKSNPKTKKISSTHLDEKRSIDLAEERHLIRVKESHHTTKPLLDSRHKKKNKVRRDNEKFR